MQGIGDFVVRAPRGGPFQLQQRCLWALTHRYVDLINEILVKYSWSQHHAICAEIQKIFKEKIFALPTYLVQSIIDHISSAKNEHVNVALSLALLLLAPPMQHELELKLNLTDKSSPLLIAQNARSFTGLVRLFCSGFRANDDVLLALADSNSANTLKTIALTRCWLSDKSAPAWARFCNLQDVSLTVCSVEGIETHLAVSNLSSLRTLELPKAQSPDLVKQILGGPDRLPQVETLWFAIDASQIPSAIDLLAQKTQLRELEVLHPLSREDVLKLHRSLPKLRKLLSSSKAISFQSAEGQELISLAPRLRSLFSAESISNIRSNDDLIKLASLCPRLENLFLRGLFDHNLTDFSALSRLTRLISNNIDCYKIEKLPSSLVVLELIRTYDPANDPTWDKAAPERSKFVDMLIQLTKLTSLDLQAADEASVIRILENMTQLRRFSLHTKLKLTGQPLSFIEPLSLPFLSGLNLGEIKVDASSIYLPSMQGWQNSILESLTPHHLPNLTSSFPDPAPEEKQRQLLKFFAPQLEKASWSTSPVFDSFSTHFPRLTSLELQGGVTEEAAAKLLRNLPLLEHFSAAFSLDSKGQLEDLNWLKHSRVSSLQLTWRDHSIDGPQTQSEPALQTVVNHQTLPLISNMHIIFEGRPMSRISISNCSGLGSVYIICKGSIPAVVEIVDCPCLTHATVSGVTMKSLRLVGLPYITALHLGVYGSNLPERDSDIEINLPRLGNMRSPWNRLTVLNKCA